MPDILLFIICVISSIITLVWIIDVIQRYGHDQLDIPHFIAVIVVTFLWSWWVVYMMTPREIEYVKNIYSSEVNGVDIVVTPNGTVVNLNRHFGKDYLKNTEFELTQYKGVYLTDVGVFNMSPPSFRLEELQTGR